MVDPSQRTGNQELFLTMRGKKRYLDDPKDNEIESFKKGKRVDFRLWELGGGGDVVRRIMGFGVFGRWIANSEYSMVELIYSAEPLFHTVG